MIFQREDSVGGQGRCFLSTVGGGGEGGVTCLLTPEFCGGGGTGECLSFCSLSIVRGGLVPRYLVSLSYCCIK